MSETIIEARGLTKRYGETTAVDGIDLAVRKGEIYGLLGPNGSGKTTTILMLLGLTESDGGDIRIVGLNPMREPLKVKRRVAYLPDALGFYDHLSARENLSYSARLCGIGVAEANRRIDEALREVGLADVADRKTATFSRGMRQRLGLAEIIMRDPDVAILDEPTNGLDPSATHEFLTMIRRLKEKGVTVLLSSHLLDRVQSVCDRVGLFNKGKLTVEGTVTELARRVLGAADRIEVEAEGKDLPEVLAQVPGVAKVDSGHNGTYWLEAKGDPRPEVAERIMRSGGKLIALHRHDPSLDEIYTKYFAKD